MSCLYFAPISLVPGNTPDLHPACLKLSFKRIHPTEGLVDSGATELTGS